MGPYALGQILPWPATARKRRSLPKIGASAGPAQEPQTGKMGGWTLGPSSGCQDSKLPNANGCRAPPRARRWRTDGRAAGSSGRCLNGRRSVPPLVVSCAAPRAGRRCDSHRQRAAFSTWANAELSPWQRTVVARPPVACPAGGCRAGAILVCPSPRRETKRAEAAARGVLFGPESTELAPAVWFWKAPRRPAFTGQSWRAECGCAQLAERGDLTRGEKTNDL